MRQVPDGPILVVDDDDMILMTVAESLELEGYDVLMAANGREALEQVQRRVPGLVLLDMRMPVMDGWAFATAARERGFALNILVMSAAADARRWAQEINAQAVLPKPFELDDLLAVVGRHYGPPAIA